MSMIIEAQNKKYVFKPKKFLIMEKDIIVDQVPVKSLTKYADEGDKFLYSVRGSPSSKVVYTDHASLCTGYLSMLPKLFQLKDTQNKSVLSMLSS